jgi:hypothetical protein
MNTIKEKHIQILDLGTIEVEIPIPAALQKLQEISLIPTDRSSSLISNYNSFYEISEFTGIPFFKPISKL